MVETKSDVDILPDDPAVLKRIIFDLRSDNIRLSETIKIYQFKLFGRKSENLPKEEQPGLFNETDRGFPRSALFSVVRPRLKQKSGLFYI